MDARSGDTHHLMSVALAGYRPVVLVFLPNTNELQRFVLSGAFDDLMETYEVRFVFSSADAEKMLSAAPDVLRMDNTYELDIPKERYEEWCDVFALSCRLYGARSRSFALRVNSSPSVAPEEFSRFELNLLRNAWRVVRKLRPFLRRFKPLRDRWGEPSYASMRDIDAMMATTDKLSVAMRKLQPAAELQLLEKKIAAIRPHWPLVQLLDSVNPLFCVLPTSLLDNYCNDLLLAANEFSHTVVLLQSGWDNMSSKGMVHHYPQFAGVWGPQSARHAKTIQRIESAIPLGSPHYDALVPAEPHERDAYRKELGVGPDECLLLFGGSFRQFDETSVLQQLDEMIEAGAFAPRKVKVLYRPHPWRKDRVKEDNFFDVAWKNIVFDPDMRDRYIRSKAERRYLASAPMFDMTYLALLLSSVDVVISPMSTLLIEALIIDKPTMAVAFGDSHHQYNPAVSSKMTHFHELRKSQVLDWCADARGFADACKRLVGRHGTKNDPVMRAALLDDIVVRSDKSYSQRLDEVVRTTVETEARRSRVNRVSRIRRRVSYAYDAPLVLKEYCSLPSTPDIPGHWMHGWYPEYHNLDSVIIATHKRTGYDPTKYLDVIEEDKKTVPQWVSRRDQELFLRQNGYQHVKAIGLPFAYLPSFEGRRVPGSLLVMPPHSHKTRYKTDIVAETYADGIERKRNQFSEVWVCLNVDDYMRGEWVESFRKRNIPILVGAEQGDPRTLFRLKHLLSSFEYVTTNGFGSHVAYAAAAGAKLSIWGPAANCPAEEMSRGYVCKVKPHLTETVVSINSVDMLRKHHPSLFVEPEKASVQTEWGRHQIGEDIRLDPLQLMACFGWKSAYTR